MPLGTFHLLLGVLFFAVWGIAAIVGVRQRDAQGSRPSKPNKWHHSAPR